MTAFAKTITGRLSYRKADGTEWGQERLSVSEHGGSRTYRSSMEMDGFGIFREANWSMTMDGAPLEGFSRETSDGNLIAHNWYRIDGRTAEFESYSADKGRQSRRIEARAAIGHLGLHVILSDCMVSAGRGCDDIGIEKPVICLANSLDGYGREPTDAFFVEPLVTYLGTEPVSVPAGTFEGEHFAVRWSKAVPKPSHFWVLKGVFLPLRLEGASDPVTYELAELDLG